MTSGETILQIFIVLTGIIALFSLAFAVVMYVFQGIGLYAISSRRKLGLSAFAWIPILNMFKFGQIADDAYLNKNGKKSYFMVFYPVTGIAGYVICSVGMFMIVGSFAFISDLANGFIHGSAYEIEQALMPRVTSQVGLTIGIILFVLGIVLSIFSTVLEYIALYHIYKSCSRKYVVMFILSMVFSVLVPFFLFAVRRQDNTDYYRRGATPRNMDAF